MPVQDQRRVTILGVAVDRVSGATLPDLVEDLIARPGTAVLAPVNIDIINKAVENPALRDFLGRADIVYTDGAGPVLGSWLLGDPLPGRVTSIHLIHKLCERWRDGRRGIYFLGGKPGIADQAADTLRRAHPGVRIAGTFRGHLTTDDEEAAAIADIRAKKPDVLCVGFGSPIQEDFIDRHLSDLGDIPLVWPVGALTTHIAEIVPRAPRLMRRLGFEWLHRFALEPRRLWRRYLIGNPHFVLRVVSARLSER